MRGAGVGILFTSMILLIANKPKEITDAEIKLRAAELGMVEQTLLSNEQQKEENNTVEEKENADTAEKETEDIVETETAESEITKSETANTVETEIAENSLIGEGAITEEEMKEESKEDPELALTEEPEEEPLEEQEEKRYISLTIESGDVARTVSTKLYEAGLIESIEEYSNFLSGNNYSYRLRAGVHQIPIGADHQEIAEILCKITGE